MNALGVRVISLPAEPDFPDAVFVEDPAVVVDEVTVITTMGCDTRRREVESLAGVLSSFRPLKYLKDPAKLEGGDVMRVGRTLYVGLSTRTNHEGIAQLATLLTPYDYDVRAVVAKSCLHLKTGCTFLGRDTILINPEWVDKSAFEDFDLIEVPASEPWGANALTIGDVTLLPSSFSNTRALLEQRGFNVQSIDISELLKAEAGLTCMSIIF